MTAVNSIATCFRGREGTKSGFVNKSGNLRMVWENSRERTGGRICLFLGNFFVVEIFIVNVRIYALELQVQSL